MLAEVMLPVWCKKVVVVADAAYPWGANLQAIQARGWFFVIALPAPGSWLTAEHLRDVVTHLPIHRYRQVRVPLVVPTSRRRVFCNLYQAGAVGARGRCHSRVASPPAA